MNRKLVGSKAALKALEKSKNLLTNFIQLEFIIGSPCFPHRCISVNIVYISQSRFTICDIMAVHELMIMVFYLSEFTLLSRCSCWWLGVNKCQRFGEIHWHNDHTDFPYNCYRTACRADVQNKKKKSDNKRNERVRTWIARAEFVKPIFRTRPVSWSGGQSFWLLNMRSRIRFPVLPWGFFLEGEDSHGDDGLSSLVELRFKALPGTS
jgi:hypothetical protein